MRFNLQCYIFIVLFVIFLSLGSFCQADDRARDRATLRGIQSIIVKVHPVDEEWKTELAKVGLLESALQSAIEHQLKKAGIQVVSEEASSRSEFEGILNVRLKFSDSEPVKKRFPTDDKSGDIIEKVDVKKRYIYAIRLNLRQLVALKRDPFAEAFSITWQAESVAMRRLALMKDDIKSLVDVFIEAYTSENPAPLKTN